MQAAAFRAYAGIAVSAPSAAVREAAQSRGDEIQGKGSLGARAEYLLERFVKDASDPTMIFPMMAGSFVYGIARNATLSRLVTSARASIVTRGMGARLASGLSGYALEVPVFTLFGRATRWLAGMDSKSQEFGNELASSALSLGVLKSSGVLAGAFSHGGSSARRFLVGQASMFAGMLASHKLEERLGWRARVDGATMVTDILASMLSLGVGSHLGHWALGPRLARFRNELSARAQITAGSSTLSLIQREAIKGIRGKVPTSTWLQSPVFGPLWMMMGVGGIGGSGRGAGLARRASEENKISHEDVHLLKEAYAVYWQNLGREQWDPRLPSPIPGLTHQELAGRLDGGNFTETEWRNFWMALAKEHQNFANASSANPAREASRVQSEKLIQRFFLREGWDPFPKTAHQRLLYVARRAVALRFGGPLPVHSGIKGIGNHECTLIQKWLQGEEIAYSRTSTPANVYGRVKSLLKGLGMSSTQIRSLIVPAVFEEQGWGWEAKTPSEIFLREVRYWVAAQSGGRLPKKWDHLEQRSPDSRFHFQEEDNETAWSTRPFSDWIQSGEPSDLQQRDALEFYQRLIALLLDLKAPRKPLITRLHASLGYEMEQNDRRYNEWEKVQGDPGEMRSLAEQRESLYLALRWLSSEHGKSLPLASFALPTWPEIEAARPSASEQLDVKDLEEALHRSLERQVTPREAKVLKMRFGIGETPAHTLEEVGEELDVSKEAVRNIESKALGKLRDSGISQDLQVFAGGAIELQPSPDRLASYPTVKELQMFAAGASSPRLASFPAIPRPENRVTPVADAALAEKVWRHVTETRYLFPDQYPFVLLRFAQFYQAAPSALNPQQKMEFAWTKVRPRDFTAGHVREDAERFARLYLFSKGTRPF